jgi:hypothetical protein
MNISITITHQPRLAIVRHRPRPPFVVDGVEYKFSPDTIPMQSEPKGTGKGVTIPILPAWWDYIKKINTPEAYDYARSVGLLWINKVDSDPPIAESVICGGNFVTWDKETDTHVRLVSYKYDQATDMLDPLRDNWHMQPTKHWKACAINEDGKIINVGKALNVYYPLLAKTELWMVKTDLEMFPPAPIGTMYELRGCDVWLVKSETKTPLLWRGEFFTDWFRLATVGVVAP